MISIIIGLTQHQLQQQCVQYLQYKNIPNCWNNTGNIAIQTERERERERESRDRSVFISGKAHHVLSGEF
jgi:hypothetical protein